MTLRRAILVSVVAWACSACFPAPLDLSGKSCSDTRPCGDPWVCWIGQCLLPSAIPDGGAPDGGNPSPDSGVDAGSDAGADAGLDAGDAGPNGCVVPANNLIANPDFELPPVQPGDPRQTPIDWHSQNRATLWVDLTDPLCGRQSAAAQADDAGEALNVVLAQTNWIAPVPGVLYCGAGWVRGSADAGPVVLQIRERDGGFFLDAGTSAGLLPDGGWQPVAASYRAGGDGVLDLRVVAFTPSPFAQINVDFVWMWRSLDGGCESP